MFVISFTYFICTGFINPLIKHLIDWLLINSIAKKIVRYYITFLNKNYLDIPT